MIFVNGYLPSITVFPNHETTIHLPEKAVKTDKVTVEWFFEDDAEIMTLLQVNSYLVSAMPKNAEVTCVIPYMPYERMDRWQHDNPFTLRALTDILPKRWHYVVIEPHSGVLQDMFADRELDLTVIPYHHFNIRKANTIYLLPDKGSVERYLGNETSYRELLKALSLGTPNIYLVGEKTRDFDTGKITGYQVNKMLTLNPQLDVEVSDANLEAVMQRYARDRELVRTNSPLYVEIIDDVCSYGGTFVNAAKVLTDTLPIQDKGRIHFTLSVAHAEASIFKGELLDYFEQISTTNSLTMGSVLTNYGNPQIDCMNVRDLYRKYLLQENLKHA